jgi:hypothetical protein
MSILCTPVVNSMRALRSATRAHECRQSNRLQERRRASVMQLHALREHEGNVLTPEEDAARRRYLLCDQPDKPLDLRETPK